MSPTMQDQMVFARLTEVQIGRPLIFIDNTSRTAVVGYLNSVGADRISTIGTRAQIGSDGAFEDLGDDPGTPMEHIMRHDQKLVFGRRPDGKIPKLDLAYFGITLDEI